MSIERYAILNDLHFPYEDKQRYPLALKIIKNIGISRLYLNGDIGEFQGVSSWPAHPTEKMGFCQELDYMNKKFDEIQELFPDVPVTYICGNHEYRLFRYIRDVAPQMWGLIDCPAILKFENRPLWKFIDYGPSQIVKCGKSNLYLRHEPLGMGKNHSKATAENSCVDLAYGHTHTWQSYTHRKFGPTPIMTKAYSLGWIGDKSRNCFDYRGAKDNWTTGFTFIETEVSSGEYSLEFVCLDSVPVFYRGKSFTLL